MGALDDILAGVREDLAIRQSSVPLERLKERCQHVDTAIDPMPRFRGPGVAVIAEVKRSSPSKGTLAQIADPAALAVEYEAGGAAAISVLTEERHFAGSLDDLVRVRCAVDIPVLRKDFIVTAYQLFEARSAGADLVLLIVAALSDPELISLVERARSIGLTPLVEVHTAEEISRAVDAGASIIGVNARNLQTLKVDPSIFDFYYTETMLIMVIIGGPGSFWGVLASTAVLVITATAAVDVSNEPIASAASSRASGGRVERNGGMAGEAILLWELCS